MIELVGKEPERVDRASVILSLKFFAISDIRLFMSNTHQICFPYLIEIEDGNGSFRERAFPKSAVLRKERLDSDTSCLLPLWKTIALFPSLCCWLRKFDILVSQIIFI